MSDMHESSQSIRDRFSRSVVPNYARFPLVIREARGFEIVDVDGRRYLDMGCGIAVNCLGHSHPDLQAALQDQMGKLDHISNLYHFEEQVALAEALIARIGPGKCFFCNSGAEANEAIIKLARKFGDPEGRYDILTTTNSFHGRTLATIAATGQEKVRTGFGPLFPGFSQVPYNDLEAMKSAVTDRTIAILIEGVQGEGGLTPASVEYLKGIRELCDSRNMLFLMDGVQCGHFRTGRFQSIQRILNLPENTGDGDAIRFMPDAISLGKSLGGGFPTAGIWASWKVQDVLGAGSHGTTYGGNPLACRMASTILDVISRDQLNRNILQLEPVLRNMLNGMTESFPDMVETSRGLGFMQGLVLRDQSDIFKANDKMTPSVQVTLAAQERGLIIIPAGPRVVRFLPAYNIEAAHIEESGTKLHDALTDIKNTL